MVMNCFVIAFLFTYIYAIFLPYIESQFVHSTSPISARYFDGTSEPRSNFEIHSSTISNKENLKKISQTEKSVIWSDEKVFHDRTFETPTDSSSTFEKNPKKESVISSKREQDLTSPAVVKSQGDSNASELIKEEEKKNYHLIASSLGKFTNELFLKFEGKSGYRGAAFRISSTKVRK